MIIENRKNQARVDATPFDGGDAPLSPSIVRRAAAGDHDAFEIFTNRYKSRLHRYIRCRVADSHRAEDLTQEVFLRAFRAAVAGDIRDGRSLTPWIFTIANNCVNDYLRLCRRKPLEFDSNLEPGADSAAPGLRAERAEADRSVMQLLAKLPEPQRRVICMKLFAGMTFNEIAEALSIPITTAKSRMRYGLDKLHTILCQEAQT